MGIPQPDSRATGEIAMSFDIFFQPARFTHDAQGVLANEPLSPVELQAVQQVLARANAHGPDAHGCYVVHLNDGGSAEVYGAELATGCMVALRGTTAELLQFLLHLLEAGNWVMLPAMADTVAITAAPASVKGLPDEFPRVVICNSAAELGVLLADGVQAWEQYRAQVLADAG